ncbi:hypothetical protein Lal_00033766 [Lupinus albus]|nr:hypothetical protein Lal_00033766 [Lupinus albus]
MAGRGRGTSQNIPNDLLAPTVAALQQVNENLQSLNQNATPSPSSHPLVPPDRLSTGDWMSFVYRSLNSSKGDSLRML